MLQSMRHLAQSWLFKGLMALLVVSFGIWGVGDMFRGNALERSVAKTGRRTITVQQLDQEFQQDLARARQSFGPDLTPKQAQALGILNSALDALVQRAQVDQDIDRLGIDVSEKAVVAQLMSQPQFMTKDGKFNKELFHDLLDRAHLSEQEFITREQQDIARHQLIDTFNQETPVPQIARDTILRARSQQMVFDVVTLSNDSVKDVAAPDEQLLHAFYDTHPKDFTAPETRSVTIAELSSDAIMKDIQIGDADIQKEYDAKSDELTRPERRDALQVVLQSEDKAKELAAAAKLSGNLPDAAKKMGYEAILLKQSDQSSLLPELSQPVFALTLNQVSEPVHSSLGWHVVQVTKILPAGKPPLADIRDDLREAMRRDQAGDKVARMVNQLDDDLAAGHSLDDIADGLKLRLIKIPALTATGKTPEGKDPAELPFRKNVLDTAFAQNNGESSPVMDDKQGNFYVVRTDEITPSAVRPYDQVKDKVAAAWQADAKARKAKETADKIVTALRDNKPLGDFKGQNGMEIRQSKPVSLIGETDPDLPAVNLPDMLKLKKGEVASFSLPDHQLIVRLAQLSDGKPDDAARSRIAKDLQTRLPQEHAEQYLKYLRSLYPVTVHEDAVDQVAQRGS